MEQNELLKKKLRAEYLRGKLEAYYDFSWMKDGVTYLGTCGTRYVEFTKPLRDELAILEYELGNLERR